MKIFLIALLATSSLLGQGVGPDAKPSIWKRIVDVRGKPMFWVSVGALALAHGFDYQTTETAVQGGFGNEANPFLQRLVLNRNHFAGFKIGAGVVPVGLELWHLRSHPQYRPVYTITNFGMAGTFGAVAWRNHQISVDASK